MIDRDSVEVREEHRLVQAAQADPHQFIPLYDRYFKRIYHYVLARVGDTQTAEDLTAQVFLKCLESLPRYRPDAPFAAWLFTIARHTVISHYRRERPSSSYDDEPANTARDEVPEWVEAGEELARLRELLAELEEDERELLRLRFAAGLTYREIAAMQGRSRGAVKMAAHRLLRRLQREMEDAR